MSDHTNQMPTHMIRFADLATRKRTYFTLTPDAAERAAIAQAIDALILRKLKFQGALVPVGKRDWRIEGTLGATVQQACVVTLEPITTRLDQDVARSFAAEIETPDAGSEFEIPFDDMADPLPDTIDLYDVLCEELVLGLPAYPRKEGVEPGTASFTEPGKAPMTDADARPFAGLAALRDSLENKDDETD